jgi:hypothetical protein
VMYPSHATTRAIFDTPGAIAKMSLAKVTVTAMIADVKAMSCFVVSLAKVNASFPFAAVSAVFWFPEGP